MVGDTRRNRNISKLDKKRCGCLIFNILWYNFVVMMENNRIPQIKVAEVFVDGHCVGFISDVKLNQVGEGCFDLEGEWSGYSDVLADDKMFTISIPRHECRFFTDKVDAVKVKNSGRVLFKGASFLPDGPDSWFDKLIEPPDDLEV